MQSTASVEIDRPVDEVFELTNKNVPDWSIIVIEDELVEDNGGVGDRLRIVTEERGRKMEFEGIVTRWEPPRVSALEMKGSSFDIQAEYTFEDVGNGRTIVTQQSEVHGKGMFGLFLKLFGWLMAKQGCKATESELLSLKRYCENQPAT